MPDEERKYYDSASKRKWQKENTIIISIRLQKKTDKDLLEYFESQKELDDDFSVGGAFKKALREKIEREYTT